MSEETKNESGAYKTTFSRLEELADYHGREVGCSDWMLLTQDRIDAFANATDDRQWIHTNPEMAKKYSPFPGTIAHGFLILSLASRFCYEALEVEEVGMGLNYGLDRVRFPQSVPSGSLIRGRVALEAFEAVEGGAKVKLGVTVEVKGAEKPACVAEFISMLYVDPERKKPRQQAEKQATPGDEEKTVLYERQQAVAVITLNRPERYNAVNPRLIGDLREALEQARRDDSVRAVVLTGQGQGFCAGADLEVFRDSPDPQGLRDYIIDNYQPLLRAFVEMRKPIIGAINGTAAGLGAALALACDLRVMGKNSHLLYAFINIGLGPDGGAAWLLARLVGYSRAFQIAVEGEKIPADRCLDLGLTNKVVEDKRLLSETVSWAKQLALQPTLAVGITKADLYHSLNHNIFETITFEAEQQTAAFGSHDLQEGVLAFMQKRKPRFLGK